MPSGEAKEYDYSEKILEWWNNYVSSTKLYGPFLIVEESDAGSSP
jgi:hypothetical protein